jgi:hypothetical protein
VSEARGVKKGQLVAQMQNPHLDSRWDLGGERCGKETILAQSLGENLSRAPQDRLQSMLLFYFIS